jgi:26S proteasome regulatory subunit T4
MYIFCQVVSSAIVDKYIGESARLIREMFNYARDHQPCIIFMDEIDAIGGRRFSEGTSADREIQRTLMELLNQMDGFDSLGQVRVHYRFAQFLKIAFSPKMKNAKRETISG